MICCGFVNCDWYGGLLRNGRVMRGNLVMCWLCGRVVGLSTLVERVKVLESKKKLSIFNTNGANCSFLFGEKGN